MLEQFIQDIPKDDPAYFGGYVNENLIAVNAAMQLNKLNVYMLAKNSFVASFLDDSSKQKYLSELNDLYNLRHTNP